MKKQVLILSVLINIFANLHAQEQWNWQPIDSAYLVCRYEYLSPSILVPHNRDDMCLEIGRHISKFYSQITLDFFVLGTTPEGRAQLKEKADDVFRRQSRAKTDEEGLRIMSELPGRKSDCIVYKNYPKDTIYVQDCISGSNFCYYTEDYTPQNWQIHPDTITHLGYHCQKATCSWRGRDYEAWFTSEIPVNDGPMKFFGLPGLIVKVSDTEKAYSFVLKGIEKTDKPIYFNTETFLKNSPNFEPIIRCELMHKKSSGFKNMIRALKRDMARLGKSTDDLDENMYDVMERDCK